MPRINHARHNNIRDLFNSLENSYKATTTAHHEMLIAAAWDGKPLKEEDEKTFKEAEITILANARSIGQLALRIEKAEEDPDDDIKMEDVDETVHRIKRPGALRKWWMKILGMAREE